MYQNVQYSNIDCTYHVGGGLLTFVAENFRDFLALLAVADTRYLWLREPLRYPYPQSETLESFDLKMLE